MVPLCFSRLHTEVVAEADQGDLREWHQRSVWLMACLPKTGETVNLIDRHVVVSGQTGFSNSGFIKLLFGMEPEPDEAIDRAIARHTPVYVVGTSLLFEAVMLGLAAWAFCRRDF